MFGAVNFPGSWNDRKLESASGTFHIKTSEGLTQPGSANLGDSAFVNNTRTTMGKVFSGRNKNETYDTPQSTTMDSIDVILQRIYRSERKSTESGTIILKDPLNLL